MKDRNGNITTDPLGMIKNFENNLNTPSKRGSTGLKVSEDFLSTLLTKTSLDEAKKFIIQFEQNINKSSYSPEDKMLILSATATASSSIEYWSQNYDGFATPNGLPQSRGRCGLGCILCVAAYDVGGLLFGSIFDPATGVIVGAFASTIARCCQGVCSKDGCGWECN